MTQVPKKIRNPQSAIRNQDVQFMFRCLELAGKGRGHVSPNPLVGAVIVKNGKIIAEGYHQKLGGPHAEIKALKKIKFKAKGATLYCNLEPCFHHGRTPPCVTRVIESGVSRVVIADRDPNPKVSGKSIKLLKKSKIKVTEGVLRPEARLLNRIFLTWIQKKRPYVILKAAMSLDGKIAPVGAPHKEGQFLQRAAPHRSRTQWITGPLARKRVHELRARIDAVLVGVNTVIKDDARLNVRGIKGARQPLRVILDSQLKVPVKSRVFKTQGGRVLIATCTRSSSKMKKYVKLKASVLTIDQSPQGRVSISKLLNRLAKEEVTSLFVEGGGQVFSAFLREGLVDELILYIAPKILGKKALGLFPEIAGSIKNFPFTLYSLSFLGEDVEIRYVR